MTFDEFVVAVQRRGSLRTLGDAIRAIRCTLGVLSHELTASQASSLASHLPEEIGYYLLHADGVNDLQFPADEFIHRVTACAEGASSSESIGQIRAVLGVLRETVNDSQLNYLIEQLPPGFEPLFADSQTTVPPEDLDRLDFNPIPPAPRRMMNKRPRKNKRLLPRRKLPGAREVAPRSARLSKRARGAWHLGR